MRVCWFAFILLVFSAGMATAADESFLKRDDVIAFVGGEEMLAMSETGDLEFLLTSAFPQHHLRFRDLAWEGDTVFEQRRDLNYPPLTAQLEKVGATVVIAQFGQMESFAGREGLGAFVNAFEKMADGLAANGKRRLVLVEPTEFEVTAIAAPALKNVEVNIYRDAIRQVAHRRNYLYAEAEQLDLLFARPKEAASSETIHRPGQPIITRDGVHLRPSSLRIRAQSIANLLRPAVANRPVEKSDPVETRLRELISAKNRLWFHYRRPQNWAFLAGDRTTQPSSRDYRDPSKRWFPEEMEQFLPMIAAKETELWNAAEMLHR